MARSFNGTTDRISLTLGATLGLTLCAWIKTTTASAAACIIDNDTGSAGGRAYQLRVGSGKLQAITLTGSTVVTTTGATTINTGAWVHVAMTVPTSGVVTVYVNGVSDGVSASHGWNVAGTAVNIGAHNSGASQFFAGTIAECVLANSLLLPVRDLALLAAGVPASVLGVSNYLPLWGVDSPEPDIGIAAHAPGTLHGTSFAAGPPVGRGLVTVAGVA